MSTKKSAPKAEPIRSRERAAHRAHDHTSTGRTEASHEAVDPVCGMTVEIESPHRATHAGRSFRFCSNECRGKFEHDPERYLPAKSEAELAPHEKARRHTKTRREWGAYLPLLVIVAITLLAASAKQMAYLEGWSVGVWMRDFMGFFLLVFAMFKFFDLRGFADGFQTYDLIAKSFRPYAYLYPFIELALGLAYLAAWTPPGVYGATVLVSGLGSVGVIRALRKGRDVNCACMGTFLKVPLSTVALIEDLGMAAMAAAMWAMSLR